MDRLGPTIAAIAREKAAIIERGDLAVTGATGEALEIIRRRARRDGGAADGRRAGHRPRHGTATASRSSCRASARRGSGCAAGTRRRTSPSPTPCSTRWRRPGIATVGPGCAPARATRPRSGRAASSCWTLGEGREVLLDGAHNPAGAAALAGARRPAAAPRARAADAGHGVHGRQGRRWCRDGAGGAAGALRGATGDRDERRRAAGDAGARARRALAAPTGPQPGDGGPRPARGARCRPGRGPGPRSWPARSILWARSGPSSSTTRDLRDPDPGAPAR